jgi:hypothetical protein
MRKLDRWDVKARVEEIVVELVHRLEEILQRKVSMVPENAPERFGSALCVEAPLPAHNVANRGELLELSSVQGRSSGRRVHVSIGHRKVVCSNLIFFLLVAAEHVVKIQHGLNLSIQSLGRNCIVHDGPADHGDWAALPPLEPSPGLAL